MLTATYNGLVLHDPRMDDERFTSAKLEQSANEVDTLTFTIAPSHPLYGTMEAMSASHEVRLMDDGVELFRGRIRDDGQDMDTCTDFTCESQLSYLCDSKVRPYGTYADTPAEGDEPQWTTIAPGTQREYAEWLISQGNTYAGGEKSFSIGADELPLSSITRSSTQWPTTWGELTEKVIDALGCRVRARSIRNRRLIDLLTEGRACSQVIRFSENLTDFATTRDLSDVVTAISPVGKRTVTDADGHETTEEFGIDDMPDGPCADGFSKSGDRILSEDGVRRWGVIEDRRTYDDVSTVDGLISSVCTDLTESTSVVESMTIGAVDLHAIDSSIEPIRLLDMVRVVSPPHGVDQLIECIGVTIDVLDPSGTSYRLGTDLPTLTRSNTLTARATIRIAQSAIEQVAPISAEAKAAAKAATEAQAAAEASQVKSITTWYSADDGATWSTTQPTG